MQSRRVAMALVVGVSGIALSAPAGAGARSCVAQATSAPTLYPTQKADFITSFAGPGYGGLVSAYAHQDPAACPPLPEPPGA
jgi:hypothetical protein